MLDKPSLFYMKLLHLLRSARSTTIYSSTRFEQSLLPSVIWGSQRKLERSHVKLLGVTATGRLEDSNLKLHASFGRRMWRVIISTLCLGWWEIGALIAMKLRWF